MCHRSCRVAHTNNAPSLPPLPPSIHGKYRNTYIYIELSFFFFSDLFYCIGMLSVLGT